MKKIIFILSFLFAFVCGNGLLQAAPLTEAADTLDHYAINGQPVDNFDGSQLVGKRIISYEITRINHPTRGPVRIHEIYTEGNVVHSAKPSIIVRLDQQNPPPGPAYVIDGKQVSAEEFGQLRPSDIKNMTVINNGSRDDVKKYEGWENGVILVETKEGSKKK